MKEGEVQILSEEDMFSRILSLRQKSRKGL